MIIEAFKREHLQALRLQSAQAFMRMEIVTEEHAQLLESTEAYTAIEDGRVVACAGVMKAWEGRVMAWSLLAENIGAITMMKVHHAVKRFLVLRTERRIEMDVDINHPEAHRWAAALGFVNETPNGRRNYSPQGENYCLYARCI